MTICICTNTWHGAVQTLSWDFIFRKKENLFWGDRYVEIFSEDRARFKFLSLKKI
jgi:hypothetical protein